jgi:hypothetical protein
MRPGEWQYEREMYMRRCGYPQLRIAHLEKERIKQVEVVHEAEAALLVESHVSRRNRETCSSSHG